MPTEPSAAGQDLPAGGGGRTWRYYLPFALMPVFVTVVVFSAWLAWKLTRRRPPETGHSEEPSMSADTVSSLFPDRPIRPLPKRRLRERLSPEVADSIQYPPTPQASSALFYYPYSLREDDESTSSASGERSAELDSRQSRRNGTVIAAGGGDEDDSANRRNGLYRSNSDLVPRSARPPPKPESGRQSHPQQLLSASSPVDGYDLFENTNNKKKRKIPTVGETALNGNRFAIDPETGETTLIKPDPDVGDPTSPGMPVPYSTSVPYYMSSGLSSGAPNVPGPGRGRYGRVRNGRSPLGALAESNNNWAGRNAKLRPGQWAPSSSENTGIISSAIANAEKLPPEPGQENISLLQQQQTTKSTLASGSFTFTCDSQVPGSSLAWPGSDRRSAMGNYPSTSRHNGDPQESPEDASTAQPTNAGTGSQGAESASQGSAAKSGTATQDPAAAERARRRRERKELKKQGKDRQRLTQLNKKLHPPEPGEGWVCYFCDYEAIFGEKPWAIIEKYERKELKERKKQEERKANLAKRRQNPKRGPKKSRSANKQATTSQRAHQSQENDSMNANPSLGTQSEELYEGEYEEDDADDVDEYPCEYDSKDGEPLALFAKNHNLPPPQPGEGVGGGSGDGGKNEGEL